MTGPLHRPSPPTVSWTTGNVGEAIPGVQTPLSYTFWTVPFERTVRGSYGELGVISRREAALRATRIEDVALGTMYGRPVLNVNLILQVGAGLPGVTARDVARNVLGTDDLAYLPPGRPARYPVVAVRLPLLARQLRRRMVDHGHVVRASWAAAAQHPATGERGASLLRAIRHQFTWALLNHSHATFLSQACLEQLDALAATVDQQHAVSDLLSGFGGMLEVGMLQQLWEVAQGRGSLDGFLAVYGYQGPNAGNLAARSWREDPGPLHRVLRTYAHVGADAAPRATEVRRREARERAETELLRALPRHRRAGARLLLRLAQHYIPLREVGKSQYLQAGDAARATIRRIGADLGLEQPEDVFFLTFDELVEGAPATAIDQIGPRRAQYEEYLELDVPPVFNGTPEPLRPAAPAHTTHFDGVAAAGGVVEGIARVVRDPTSEADPLEVGEILVASATDPSWTTLFLGAGGVVIDVGGKLSHGAIVARELGIPCVSGARDASAIIRTGDRLRVDGTAGTVTVLEPSEPS